MNDEIKDMIDAIENDDRRVPRNGTAALVLGICVIALIALLAFLAFLWWHPTSSCCCCCQQHSAVATPSTTTLGQANVFIPPAAPWARPASRAAVIVPSADILPAAAVIQPFVSVPPLDPIALAETDAPAPPVIAPAFWVGGENLPLYWWPAPSTTVLLPPSASVDEPPALPMFAAASLMVVVLGKYRRQA